MDERIKNLKTTKDCEVFAKNATDRNHPELAIQARQQAVKLRADQYGAKSQAERDCLEAVCAYEEVLTAKNNRRTKASRTWQMIQRHGIIGAVERAVNRDAETVGYLSLRDIGLESYAFEAVVLRYRDLFSEEALHHAQSRVDEWGR